MENENVKQVKELILNHKGILRNPDYFKALNEILGKSRAAGEYSTQYGYNLLEIAINQIFRDYFLNLCGYKDTEMLGYIDFIYKTIPTQAARTIEKTSMEQYSTVHHISYYMAQYLQLSLKHTVLEPSAGTGNLLTFLNTYSHRYTLNEIDINRLSLLTEQYEYAKATNLDAMYLLNYNYYRDTKFDRIIMNPPFTASVNSNKKSSDNGLKHLDQALGLLADKGRVVALLGESVMKKKSEIATLLMRRDCKVVLNVKIPGKFYYKYGTTYNVNVVVIDKNNDKELTEKQRMQRFVNPFPIIHRISEMKELIHYL
jgi:predicted RNA methylase